MTTPKVGAPELSTSQASKEATVNEQIRRVEAGASLYLVIDKDLTTPPGSCADGAQYIVAGGGGAWAGHIGDIAIAVGTNASNGWYFRDPEEGVFAWVQDEDLLYRCTTGTSPATWTEYVPSTIHIVIEEGGIEEGTIVQRLNFTGAGKSVSVTGNEATIDIPGGFGGTGGGNLNDLDDVNTSGESDGQVLRFNGGISPGQWEPSYPEFHLIEEKTPTGVGTVTFSSLGSGYKAYQLRIVGRGTQAANSVNLLLQFNGDTGANYDYQYAERQGNANNTPTSAFAQTSTLGGVLTAANAVANTPADMVVDIAQPEQTTFHKTTRTSGGYKSSNAAAGIFAYEAKGYWRSTAAITSITALLSAGNYDTGTKISLYGLR